MYSFFFIRSPYDLFLLRAVAADCPDTLSVGPTSGMQEQAIVFEQESASRTRIRRERSLFPLCLSIAHLVQTTLIQYYVHCEALYRERWKDGESAKQRWKGKWTRNRIIDQQTASWQKQSLTEGNDRKKKKHVMKTIDCTTTKAYNRKACSKGKKKQSVQLRSK